MMFSAALRFQELLTLMMLAAHVSSCSRLADEIENGCSSPEMHHQAWSQKDDLM
jgi:hypothetical protein